LPARPWTLAAWLVSGKSTRPENPHQANSNPENVEQGVRPIFFDDRAPGEQDGVDRVENPDKQERTVGAEPADQGKAEDPHQYSDHFEFAQMLCDQGVDWAQQSQHVIPFLDGGGFLPSQVCGLTRIQAEKLPRRADYELRHLDAHGWLMLHLRTIKFFLNR
jgi:hypothetical protein